MDIVSPMAGSFGEQVVAVEEYVVLVMMIMIGFTASDLQISAVPLVSLNGSTMRHHTVRFFPF